MANQSKYTFSEVEKKLDIIKDNQGSNKVLLGDGTYGEKPKDGTDGEDGVGIGNISKTNTVGLVDTYTITFTDGNTTTFTITNGENGTDGVGIVSVQKTATNGLVDTYTIIPYWIAMFADAMFAIMSGMYIGAILPDFSNLICSLS